MKSFLKSWPLFLSLSLIGVLMFSTWSIVNRAPKRPSPWLEVKKDRAHVDHSAFFKDKISSPQEVTKKCLECHKDAAKEVHQTAHWNWADKVHGLGKTNLVNNFCMGIEGNWPACTKCHVGYGWSDKKFDFKNEENVDCLVCHDWSGQYVKGKSGLPTEKTDLMVAAKSVGYPKRENCSNCHSYGGGGLGVKHGDIDTSLLNPTESLDIHMGKHGFLCVDCHKTTEHEIRGKAYSVSIDSKGGFDCTECHKDHFHQDQRLNAHLDSVACQTCHIPSYARKQPTKMDWDWSKAGDANRKNDPHTYLKIKGEFVYEANVLPKYYWFNKTVTRYLKGDKIDPKNMTDLNKPNGDIKDKNAKIWPFKLHDGKQIYDAVNMYLMLPLTAGKGGFWTDFNWDQALRLSESHTGLKYSGKYDFAETRMYWPLSHMVTTKDKALSCNDCHGQSQKRMDWKALGYEGDPLRYQGGRWKNFNSKTPTL